MEFNRDELLDVLKIAGEGVSKNKHVPHYRLINFKNDRVITNNGRVYCEVMFPSQLNCFVDFAKLKTVVSKLGVSLSLSESDHYLIVKSGNNKTRLKKYDTPPSFAFVDSDEISTWNEFSESLYSAIGATLPSASLDVTQTAITGVHITPSLVITTNRSRVTCVKFDTGAPNNFTIHRDLCNTLLKVGKPVSFAIDDNAIYISYGDIFMKSPLILEDYPQAALDLPNLSIDDRVSVELPPEIYESVERVGIVSQTDFPLISVSSEFDGKVHIDARNDAVGESKEVLALPNDQPVGFEFKINPKYFIDIIPNSCNLYYKDNKSPIYFKNEDTDRTYISVVAPVV